MNLSLKIFRRSLRTCLYDSESALPLLYLLLCLLGVFFGNMASSRMICAYRLDFSEWFLFLSEIAALPLLLISATSYLGILFTPVIVFGKCFLFSSVVSSLYVYSDFSFAQLMLRTAAPAFIALPVFLLLADYSFSCSRQLIALRFGRGSNRRKLNTAYILLLCFVTCLVEFIYCIYIIPPL